MGPDQNIAETSDGISVRDPVAGFHFAGILKSAIVHDFIPGVFIGKAVQVLQ